MTIKPPASGQDKEGSGASMTDPYDSEMTNNEFETDFFGYNNMSQYNDSDNDY